MDGRKKTDEKMDALKEELKYTIALMDIRGVGSVRARLLIDTFGSAKAAYEANDHALLSIPRIGRAIVEQRADDTHLQRAERELDFADQHHIKVLLYGHEGYPSRLLDCPDAPTLLFYLGEANLESRHIISIVGTRKATQYGRDCVAALVKELGAALPDLVVVSGLALGIDVSAHRASLDAKVKTVGVVAHGLDRVYPANHRNIARMMIAEGGGMCTEYLTGTDIERGNFLARNRIIAGLADATIVAESRDRGGSLITASIALDYNRDVFAFPGRTTDDRSSGCNRLIRLNRAGLITCADDLLDAMNWRDAASRKLPLQPSIDFGDEGLSPIARSVLDLLQQKGDLRLGQLCNLLPDTTRAALIEEMLQLEINGKVCACPGGVYRRRT